LPNNKAGGFDNLSYELLKYGGSQLYSHLTNLFNRILQTCCYPTQWNKGLIIPLHKGHGKPKTDPNSYRGVSLLPVVFKVFEKILDKHLPSLKRAPGYPNSQQCGFQKSLSSIHTSFNLSERGDSVYVAFLDSKKGFDTVWHDGLFDKLFNHGIQDNIWRLLGMMYREMQSAVLINGKTSRWFPVKRGVRQGGVLSARLYVLYINDLLQQLTRMKKGAFIIDINVSAPTQADDIAVISPTRDGLQQMLLVCEQYSR